MNEWRTIDSIPRGDITVLAYFPTRRGYIARQDVIPIRWSGWGGGCWENATSGQKVHDKPTHWLPLPDPPSEEREPRK